MGHILALLGAAAGGATGAVVATLWFMALAVPSSHKPMHAATVQRVVKYSAWCGAVLGLILVLTSGQRL
jgi:hypothetical protein